MKSLYFSVLIGFTLFHQCTAASTSAQRTIRQDFFVNENFSYTFNVAVGSPQQLATVALDFGSADLVISLGPNICLNQTCDWYGVYNSVNFNQSETAISNKSYVTNALSSDGTKITGIWCRDTVAIGNLGSTVVNNTNLLITTEPLISEVDEASNVPNVLGIGPRGLQATVMWADDNGVLGPVYTSLLYGIDGVYPGYSVWVDPANHHRGTIIFGGIDDSLYEAGSLINSPLAMPQGIYGNISEPPYLAVAYYQVSAVVRDASVRWTATTWNVSESLAILDSRVRFSMPLNLLMQVGKLLSAQWSISENMYIVRCDVEGTLSINIGVTSLNTSITDHLIPLNAADKTGAALCGLNIGEADQMYISNLVLKNYFLSVDYMNYTVSFGTPVTEGQSKRERPFAAKDLYPPANLLESVSPSGLVYQTETHTARIVGPEFYTSQTSQFLLNQEPVPSVLNSDNSTANSSILMSTATNSGSKRPASTYNTIIFAPMAVMITLTFMS